MYSDYPSLSITARHKCILCSRAIQRTAKKRNSKTLKVHCFTIHLKQEFGGSQSLNLSVSSPLSVKDSLCNYISPALEFSTALLVSSQLYDATQLHLVEAYVLRSFITLRSMHDHLLTIDIEDLSSLDHVISATQSSHSTKTSTSSLTGNGLF